MTFKELETKLETALSKVKDKQKTVKLKAEKKEEPIQAFEYKPNHI